MKDTMMWVGGIILALASAGMMIWTTISGGLLLALGTLGVLFIAVGARGLRRQGPD